MQLDALAYNFEGDSSSFSALERTRIVDIWHRVAEDLAPYDIDVTTERPAVFNSTTGTILVTHSIDANGNTINCTSCGGVAYVNVFGRSNYHTYYSPALVFYDKLGGGGETYVAEASSHEFGHNLGLPHDDTTTGTTYYGGHGSGLVSWAPIMGNSYNNNVTEWSRGEYANAWSSRSSDGDNFRFEYSVNNGSSFQTLFTVSATSSSNLQMATLFGTPSGSVIIRVMDTDRTRAHREADTVNVDHLYIQVNNPANEPPNGIPGGLNAQALSHSQINLSWSNGSSNESGLKVEHSLNGTTGWAVIADLPAASTSYNNTGLTPQTTYFYRVSAYTQPQLVSDFTSDSATTPEAPPQPSLNLAASGSKVKGQQLVSLSWTGPSSVAVYRDGSLVTTVGGGSYDDNLGKGGGTYIQKVCDTNSGACSNETTTTL